MSMGFMHLLLDPAAPVHLFVIILVPVIPPHKRLPTRVRSVYRAA